MGNCAWYRIAMKLHRSEVADWNDLSPGQLNAWQRLAVRTNGVVTPGNVISLMGALVVIYGLIVITRHHLTAGIIIVVAGRLADVLDGMAAEASHTKSPLGETVDATVDKVLIALALIVMLSEQLLPPLVGLVMLLQAGYNSAVSLIAKYRPRPIKLHPSRAGKLSAVFEWLSVGLYIWAADARGDSPHQGLLIAAGISFGLFVALGGWASFEYTRVLQRRVRS